MQLADRVTFCGGGPDGLFRDAALRDDPAAVAALRGRADAICLPMWRGKPLVAGAGADRLFRPAFDAPILRECAEDPVYLGRLGGAEGAPVFAADISAWEPVGLDPSVLGGFADESIQLYPGLPDGVAFRELRGVMTRLPPVEAELSATARALFNWHRTHRFCARCGAETRVSHAGWQRACPACRAQHFPRTDPVVIMLVTRGTRVLLGRSHAFPAGMYSLLAGFVEPGETVEAAVRREVAEETGIRVGRVRFLASQPWPFPASLMLGCVAEALDETIRLDPVEIEDARWFTRDDILAAVAGESPLRAARPGAIAHAILTAWLADSLD